MEEYEVRYCDNCKKDTKHIVDETAMEVIFTCTECHDETDIVKTFF